MKKHKIGGAISTHGIWKTRNNDHFKAPITGKIQGYMEGQFKIYQEKTAEVEDWINVAQ
jgi:hypothetical protein